MCYDYSVLIGDLSGVDMLLEMDWLYIVHDQLDFSMMTAKFGPVQEVNLRTCQKKKDTPSDGKGFIHAHEPTTLLARHVMAVTCVATGGWPTPCDAVLESNVMLRDGVDLLDCTVRDQTDIDGSAWGSSTTPLKT